MRQDKLSTGSPKKYIEIPDGKADNVCFNCFGSGGWCVVRAEPFKGEKKSTRYKYHYERVTCDTCKGTGVKVCDPKSTIGSGTK